MAAAAEMAGAGCRPSAPLPDGNRVTRATQTMHTDTQHQLPAHLEVDHLVVAYERRRALDDISFRVAYGDRVVLVGPNGAGKSTLFKALVGLVKPQSGTIRIHGMPLGVHTDCVAYVPQREDVDWRFPVTVADVVMMGRFGRLGWFGRPGRADRAAVEHGMELMGVAHLARQSIGDLSGGQQQRVFLARALAQEPHILLLDEPFTGVDLATQETTLSLLDALHDQKVTIILSTHDLGLAAARFERVLLINRRLIGDGTPAEVLTHEHLSDAFGGQVLTLPDGAVLVDQCACHEQDEILPKVER